jgi:hypothetical protein
MKTFKLVACHVLNKNEEFVNIPLIDALIINKENENNTWLIEIFSEQKYLSVFEEFQTEEHIKVYVVITHPDNDPAPFITRILSNKKIGENASILLEAKLDRTIGYAEQLLEHLLESGLVGNDLLTTFQEKMKDKKAIIRKKE